MLFSKSIPSIFKRRMPLKRVSVWHVVMSLRLNATFITISKTKFQNLENIWHMYIYGLLFWDLKRDECKFDDLCLEADCKNYPARLLSLSHEISPSPSEEKPFTAEWWYLHLWVLPKMARLFPSSTLRVVIKLGIQSIFVDFSFSTHCLKVSWVVGKKINWINCFGGITTI